MPANILIVDSFGQGEELEQFLQPQGYQCFLARGPLRVRAILESCRIEAIIWKSNGESDSLQKDFGHECSHYPHIPVVNLYNTPEQCQDTAFSNSNLFAASYDAYATELIPLLRRMLNAKILPAFNPVQSELAFRNVFMQIPQSRANQIDGSPENEGDLTVSAPDTSVNAGERAELFSFKNEPIGGGMTTIFSLKRFLKG